jgi:hypothetical protein
MEGLAEEFFQSVQNQVRQRRRDDSALRRPRLRGEQSSLFNVAGGQPFLEHCHIPRDVLEHPIVADVIEATFYVTFQHPLRRVVVVQCFETLLDGVSRGIAPS